MTPEERAYMQSLIDNMHGQFIHAVAAGRGMKDDDVRKIADGRVWTGQQALSLKLIDQIADFQAALKDTARSVGIRGEPSIVRPVKPKKTLSDLLFGDVSDFLPDKTKLLESNVGFYYLWK
jgi:protease-4